MTPTPPDVGVVGEANEQQHSEKADDEQEGHDGIVNDHLSWFQGHEKQDIASNYSMGETSCQSEVDHLSPNYANPTTSTFPIGYAVKTPAVDSIEEEQMSYFAANDVDVSPDVIREQQQILEQIRAEEESMKLSRFLAQQMASEDVRQKVGSHGVSGVPTDLTAATEGLPCDFLGDNDEEAEYMNTVQYQEFIRLSIHQRQEAEKADFKLAAQLADIDLREGKKNQINLLKQGDKHEAFSSRKQLEKKGAIVHVKDADNAGKNVNNPICTEEGSASVVVEPQTEQHRISSSSARLGYHVSERIVSRDGKNIRMTIFSEEIP
eukprot:CAMPEP_0196812388 /NCGR_PEP_ID=MMETSP1362-20130617/25246_1 /TAXON_ID=163516 /ORGANISM="Leptocylindrus danicus, Strain CCMP1856" /LENGTH=320 /DNA_ID=CAMNT_0042188013 /DNA_START=131 /DNA_END=1093 /DNA_ORIENTATION=+